MSFSASSSSVGIAWSVVGYFSQGGAGAALGGAAAVFFAVVALGLIWLAVFVVIVIQKGIRVLGGEKP